jgi:hypothetical protein
MWRSRIDDLDVDQWKEHGRLEAILPLINAGRVLQAEKHLSGSSTAATWGLCHLMPIPM